MHSRQETAQKDRDDANVEKNSHLQIATNAASVTMGTPIVNLANVISMALSIPSVPPILALVIVVQNLVAHTVRNAHQDITISRNVLVSIICVYKHQ